MTDVNDTQILGKVLESNPATINDSQVIGKVLETNPATINASQVIGKVLQSNPATIQDSQTTAKVLLTNTREIRNTQVLGKVLRSVAEAYTASVALTTGAVQLSATGTVTTPIVYTASAALTTGSTQVSASAIFVEALGPEPPPVVNRPLKPFNCHCPGTGTTYSGGGGGGGNGGSGSGSGFSGETINPGCNVCIDNVSPTTFRLDITATGGFCFAKYNGSFNLGYGLIGTTVFACDYYSNKAPLGTVTTGSGEIPVQHTTGCPENAAGGNRFELVMFVVGFGIRLEVFKFDGFANVVWATYALTANQDQTTDCLNPLTLTLVSGGTDSGTVLGNTCTITAI